MAITRDITLKGNDWRIALDKLKTFYPNQNLQPHYRVFVISAALGIMFDKQSNMAGEDVIDEDNKLSVPRSVLNIHESDIEFLIQTAILSSKLIDFNSEERVDIAFNPENKYNFDKLDFLIKFANYGVSKLIKKLSDDPVETMQTLKEYMSSIVGGYNYEVDGINDDDLSISDIE